MSPSSSVFFNLSDDILFTCTPAGTITSANIAWKKHLGLDISSVIGQPIESFVSSETGWRLTALLSNPSIAQPFVAEFRQRDGGNRITNLRWLRDTASGDFAVSATPLTTMTDDDRMRWQLALQSTDAGFWDWDASSGARYSSPRYSTMLGYEPYEFEATPEAIEPALHPDDRERTMQAISDFMAAKTTSYRQEFRLRHKNGTYRWILSVGSLALDTEGKPLHATGWHFDIHDRHLFDERLRESESRSRALIEALPDLLFVFDREGHYLEVEAKQPEKLIAPREKLLGAQLTDFIPGELGLRFMKAVQDAIDLDQTTTIEYTLELPSGRAYFEARVGSDSSRRRSVMIIRDLTKERTAEAAARASEEKFKHFATNAPGTMFILKFPHGGPPTYTYANENCIDMFEMDAETLIKHNPTLGIPPHPHPADAASLMSAIAKQIENMSHDTWEGRFVMPSGKVKWIRTVATPTREPDGSISFYGISFDISLQRELEKNQRYLAAVLDSSNDCVLLEAPVGNVIYANAAFLKLVGARGVLPLSKETAGHIYSENSLSRVRAGLESALREGSWQGETTLLDETGREVPTSQMILASRFEGGDVELLATVIRDISDIKSAERKMQEQKQEQQALMSSASRLAALGEMAGGIAHEINNPLTVAHAYASKLREAAKSPTPIDSKTVEFAAEKIENVCMRISRIIAGLRTIARDGTNDSFTRVRASLVVNDALALCIEKLRHLNIELRAEEIPDSLFIECRPVQISQILVNLLSNAQQAVETLPAPRWIRIACLDHGSKLEFLVCDSGPGVPSQLRERIFDPFFTTKEVGKGTGLGLSVSASIARSHGGELALVDGATYTTFALRLPRSQPGLAEI